ncbi:endonuclease/exonuclease/phosphatase family protein [Rhodohalobacter sp. 614A]|uniref:endonuclease/exonuclease/phosphatase family protein n=1 Tax=Rhodohalobacter sp. 614A TaxID=2908649 RepID=UPI001F355843|nr:endonuclease/exonuclease/phosphatase family protein [Rhodohalobacter sp. 614A]
MKKQIYLYLLLLLFAVGLTRAIFAQANQKPVAVMSYNIRYDNPGDGENAWPNRKDHVAEMIGSRYQADIAGLQEVLIHQLKDLETRLPDYEWVGVGRDDGKSKGEFSPIFYRSDRFELIATNTFWLSENPQIPGSKSWDTSITRIVTWAKFKEAESGQEFYFFNTHFDHRGEQARIESAKVLVDHVKSIAGDTPVLITGDFNVNERTEAYAIMKEEESIHDARYLSETAHEGPTSSSNNWVEMRSPESRIDYVFVNDSIQVLTHKILDDRYEGHFPSDHLPVLSTVRFK